jgi:hypothetical protein
MPFSFARPKEGKNASFWARPWEAQKKKAPAQCLADAQSHAQARAPPESSDRRCAGMPPIASMTPVPTKMLSFCPLKVYRQIIFSGQLAYLPKQFFDQ